MLTVQENCTFAGGDINCHLLINVPQEENSLKQTNPAHIDKKALRGKRCIYWKCALSAQNAHLVHTKCAKMLLSVHQVCKNAHLVHTPCSACGCAATDAAAALHPHKLLPAANHMQAAMRKQTDWLLHPCCLAIRNAPEQDKKRRLIYFQYIKIRKLCPKTANAISVLSDERQNLRLWPDARRAGNG